MNINNFLFEGIKDIVEAFITGFGNVQSYLIFIETTFHSGVTVPGQ